MKARYICSLCSLLLMISCSLLQAEQLQYYCKGNWDNGEAIFESRYFVILVDTDNNQYIIEGLIDGSFTQQGSRFEGTEISTEGKRLKFFSFDSEKLSYQFDYYASGLNRQVGSSGTCEFNPA